MDALRLRQKAETTRALAQQITDEKTRLAALDLAAHYERQAAMADAQCAPSLPVAVAAGE